ncbi:MAG TPA: hypothetical protein VN680_03085 [Burkholderiaceae bacterium]|nr:hypothetical protein [Burkholderiaceae bacterium]
MLMLSFAIHSEACESIGLRTDVSDSEAHGGAHADVKRQVPGGASSTRLTRAQPDAQQAGRGGRTLLDKPLQLRVDCDALELIGLNEPSRETVKFVEGLALQMKGAHRGAQLGGGRSKRQQVLRGELARQHVEHGRLARQTAEVEIPRGSHACRSGPEGESSHAVLPPSRQ